jgi:hypothetical protein
VKRVNLHFIKHTHTPLTISQVTRGKQHSKIARTSNVIDFSIWTEILKKFCGRSRFCLFYSRRGRRFARALFRACPACFFSFHGLCGRVLRVRDQRTKYSKKRSPHCINCRFSLTHVGPRGKFAAGSHDRITIITIGHFKNRTKSASAPRLENVTLSRPVPELRREWDLQSERQAKKLLQVVQQLRPCIAVQKPRYLFGMSG